MPDYLSIDDPIHLPRKQFSLSFWDPSQHIVDPLAKKDRRKKARKKRKNRLARFSSSPAQKKMSSDSVSRSRSRSPKKSVQFHKNRPGSSQKNSRQSSSHKSRSRLRAAELSPPISPSVSSSSSSEPIAYSDTDFDTDSARSRSRKISQAADKKKKRGKKRKKHSQKSQRKKTDPKFPSPTSASKSPKKAKKRRLNSRSRPVDSVASSQSLINTHPLTNDLEHIQKRAHRRELKLQKKLKLPSQPEKQPLLTTAYQSLEHEISVIPKMSEDAIDRKIRALQPHNFEDQQLLDRATTTSSLQEKKACFEMLLQRKLRRVLDEHQAQRHLWQRAKNTDFEDSTGKNTWANTFHEPPRSAKLQQDAYIGKSLFLGQGMDYHPPTEPHPSTFLEWKNREELQKREFTSQAHLEEAQRHKSRLNRTGRLKKMKTPLPDPANPNPSEKKFLCESYAQRINFETSPHHDKIFDSTYGHEVKHLKNALKKLEHFKVPDTPCQPLVKALALSLPHLYTAWEMSVQNTIKFQSTLGSDTDALTRHQTKARQDREISTYFLTVMRELVSALRPRNQTFDKSWSTLQKLQKLENDFPWQGFSTDSVLEDEAYRYGLKQKVIPEKKTEVKHKLSVFLNNHIQAAENGLALKESFFVGTGTANAKLQRVPDTFTTPVSQQ